MSMSGIAEVATVLTMALFLSLVVERVIQFVVRPLLETLAETAGRDSEQIGRFIPYIAAAMGAAFSWGFGLDLFAGIAEAAGLEPAAWLTRLLTAIVVAGGSNLLHDLWPQSTTAELYIGELDEVRVRDGE